MDTKNNDSILSAINNGIGKNMAQIQKAYEDSREKNAENKRLAEEAKEIKCVEKAYKYVSMEVSEVFNSLAKEYDGIKKTHPIDICIAFDAKNFVSGESTFDYLIPKSRTAENSADLHINVLEATANSVCLDRYRQGYSPIGKPLEFELENEFNYFRVKVKNLQNELPTTTPISCGMGQYVGQLCYNAQTDRFYISSRKSQILYIGGEFDILDGGVFVKATFNSGGLFYVPSRNAYYYAYKNRNRGARIIPKDI